MHVDGISFAHSSRLTGWTILVDCFELPEIEPALLGIYSGYHTPSDFDDFMQYICNDFTKSSSDGTECGDSLKIYFKLKIMPVDAPARSKCTHTKGHTAYYACPFCSQKGTRGTNVKSMQFSKKIVHPLRDSESFRTRDNMEHFHATHLEKAGALESVPGFDIVEGLPPDIMHSGDLGVVPKMLKQMLNRKSKIKLTNEQIEAINDSFLEAGRTSPVEFSRKPRDLILNINYFKATEGRGVGLYYGCKIFRQLPTQMYEHFLKYSLGIRLLSGSVVQENDIMLSELMIGEFLRDYNKFYGKSLSYVVHLLLHMPYFVRLLGPLYGFSTYRFENRLGVLKKDVRKKYQIAQQLYKRTKERGIVSIKKERPLGVGRMKSPHNFSEYKCKDFCVKTGSIADSYLRIQVDDTLIPVRVHNIYTGDKGEVFFLYKEIRNLEPFFGFQLKKSATETIHIDSQQFDIHKITNEDVSDGNFRSAPASSIRGKYVAFKEEGSTIIIPFLHNI